jgi:hypothetical protein
MGTTRIVGMYSDVIEMLSLGDRDRVRLAVSGGGIRGRWRIEFSDKLFELG